MAETDLLVQIQEYVRCFAAGHREVERIGPFLATFGLHSNGPYVNYAVPDDGCEPGADDVAELVRLYEQRGLRPRVELVASLAPAAEAELRLAGFVTEGVYSLMACGFEELRDATGPAGAEIVFAHRDEQYRAVLEVRREAFEEPEVVTQADVGRVRSTVENGGAAVLAVLSRSGQVLGSGSCLVPYGRVTELVSIGVLPAWRRSGVGAMITAGLTRAALLSGIETVYLTAVHDVGERVYERVGYSLAGRLMHLGL
jgi:ribosomal protein S18 acetylase RimI-like enzyme